MLPDDPFSPVSPEVEAAAAQYCATLAPPAWFYPLVGEVASEAVLLEFYMAQVALSLTGIDETAREVIRSSGRLRTVLKAARGRDERFDDLVADFQPLRDERDSIVHAMLWWYDADGPYGDR